MTIPKQELKKSLEKAVNHLINEWDVISICRQEYAGGMDTNEKIEWFKDILVERTMDADDYYDIQETIVWVMSNEFNVDLEDNSDRDIARDLYNLCTRLNNGEKETLDVFIANVKSTGQISVLEPQTDL